MDPYTRTPPPNPTAASPGDTGASADSSVSATAWAAMGGQAGDGIPATQQYTPMPATTATTPYNTPTAPPALGAGSITRFATPDMTAAITQQQQSYLGGSYAARSAQAYGSQGQSYAGMQQQQNLPQQHPPDGSYAARSAAAPGSYAARSASYAARSSYAAQGAYAGAQYAPQMYGQQQQQQQPNGMTPPETLPQASSPQQQGMTSQQQRGMPSPQQQGMASPQQQHGMVSPQQGMTSPQQAQQGMAQQQPQQGMTPQQQQQQIQREMGSSPQQVPSSTMSSSSYAARSVQAHNLNLPPQQQQQQQQHLASPHPSDPSYLAPPASTMTTPTAAKSQATSQAVAMQQRLLTDATRKVQEHAYYMRQAMEQRNLPVVLDRAAHMVGELGGLGHGQHHHQQQSQPSNNNQSSTLSNTGASAKLTPKNYYELYMRALEDLPVLEDFLVNLASGPVVPSDRIQIVDPAASHVVQTPFSAQELYDCVQYCPRVLSRLYLQITAGSALVRLDPNNAKYVLKDLIQACKCEQNPVRGLFLRHYLLTALRDKLPDTPATVVMASDVAESSVAVSTAESSSEASATQKVDEEQTQQEQQQQSDDDTGRGTVQDSYEFVLANFMEMNKLWVRIQHLPGEGKNKDVRKRRERERNELRILVGTNLVRLSQLEHVTSKIYGEVILNQILDHIVTCGDPLSQAYLMDCLVQAFPDEYHIETLPILLNVCPRLRDKVNIRTILQGLMDRLANYLADEELLNDESDTNQVKKQLARDSFGMFDDCVQKVYNARGPKLTSREVIRLQTALLQFSVRCYPEDMQQVARCLGVCVAALRQANASYEIEEGTVATVPHDKIVIQSLDEVAVAELEKLLSIPLQKLALKCLELDHYGDLIGFLPWENRRQVAITLLNAVEEEEAPPTSVQELEELFHVIEPLVRDESKAHAAVAAHQPSSMTHLMANLGVSDGTTPASNSLHTDPERLQRIQMENGLVCKLVHLLQHGDTDVLYELYSVARTHVSQGEQDRIQTTMVALVYAALRLVRRIFDQEHGKPPPPSEGNIKETAETLETEETPERVENVDETETNNTVTADEHEDEEADATPSDSMKPKADNEDAQSTEEAEAATVLDAEDANVETKESSPEETSPVPSRPTVGQVGLDELRCCRVRIRFDANLVLCLQLPPCFRFHPRDDCSDSKGQCGDCCEVVPGNVACG